MRPYIAVLYDSFLESTKSYVLWILLFAWTLLLGMLFPLRFTSGESYRFFRSSFRAESSAASILDSLAEASDGKGSPSQRAIYSKLRESFQKILQDRKKTKRLISVGLLIEELNKLLELDGLYSKELWPNVARSDKFKELTEKESLAPIEREKLNRKLIDSAFPGTLNSPEGRATWFSYAGIKLGNPLPFTKEAARPFIEQLFYPSIMWIGLSMVMMSISIIITSSLIPDLFQPGSLHLMLSKPISRSLLFLTKYLGGCIFVSLNVSFVLVGLYLYSGIQLEIWNVGILKCIPLFIFSFLVYYAVSCLVGLIWRNAIICVVVTMVFWAVCFVLGWVHTFFRNSIEVEPAIRGIYCVNDSLWARMLNGRLVNWDPKSRSWMSAFGEGNNQQVYGPVALEDQKALYFARGQVIPFGLGGGMRDNLRLEMAKIPEVFDPSDTTFSNPPWADSRLDSGPTLPTGTDQMVKFQKTLAAISPNGVFVFDPTKEREPENKFESVTSMLKRFGFDPEKPVNAFSPLLKNLELARPYDLCISPTFQTIAAFSKGELIIWKQANEEFSEAFRISFDIEKELVTTVGCSDTIAIVCPEGKTPTIVTLENQERRELTGLDTLKIRQVFAIRDNRFVVVDYKQNLWILDQNGENAIKPSLTGQGEVLCASESNDGAIWVAFGVKNAAKWDLSSNSVAGVYKPRLSFADSFYYFLIRPLYTVAQRPAEQEDIQEILAKNTKKTLGVSKSDMDMLAQKEETRSSVYSNMIFVSIILAICCWYLHRQDL